VPAIDAAGIQKTRTGRLQPGRRLRGAWWELFGDPDLNALEQQIDSQQTLKAADASSRRRALVRDAIGPLSTGEREPVDRARRAIR
jgi:outer membrane protein TolC